MKRYSLMTVTLLCLMVCFPSCEWSCFAPGESPSGEYGGISPSEERDATEKATDSELQDVMRASAKYMKNLEASMENGNWPATRVSAKKLEDLIGKRCVNLYVKVHGRVSRKFTDISKDFNEHVLKLLNAERYNKYELARTQFENMKLDCDNCHDKFREE